MKELVSKLGSASGLTSVLGSWQICHNICLALVALLAAIGITVTGMPLLFLTEWAPYLWSLAAILLVITFILYIKKKCISKNMLIFNSGVIIAGVPFQPIQSLSPFQWIIGGTIAGTAVLAYIDDRRRK